MNWKKAKGLAIVPRCVLLWNDMSSKVQIVPLHTDQIAHYNNQSPVY